MLQCSYRSETWQTSRQHLPNLRTIGKVSTRISRHRDFTRSCDKTSVSVVNRGPGELSEGHEKMLISKNISYDRRHMKMIDLPWMTPVVAKQRHLQSIRANRISLQEFCAISSSCYASGHMNSTKFKKAGMHSEILTYYWKYGCAALKCGQERVQLLYFRHSLLCYLWYKCT